MKTIDQIRHTKPVSGQLTIPGKFNLELGGVLRRATIFYKTLGNLNKQRNNVIWVCHALTGNADVADWWPGLFGIDKCFSPDKYFIVCANVLGSCYGSTGPLDTDRTTAFHNFPVITIRDMVKAHILLRKHLKLPSIHTLIGGSLGGQQALEWAVSEPDLIERLIPVATNAFHSPWGIAFNETQRMAIRSDPSWKENHPGAGLDGMKTARAIALLSYRTYSKYAESQKEPNPELTSGFKASGYQIYQGEKLAARFNAFSYYRLSEAMDSHHLGRGRPDVKVVLSKIKSRTLAIGVTSDLLFPVTEQKFLTQHIPGAEYAEVDSQFGHDGFLTETVKLEKVIKAFI